MRSLCWLGTRSSQPSPPPATPSQSAAASLPQLPCASHAQSACTPPMASQMRPRVLLLAERCLWRACCRSQEPYPFRLGGDDELAALAAYYHLPLFSCRNLMWDLSAVPNPDPKHHWEQWTADQDHPNDLGHRWEGRA